MGQFRASILLVFHAISLFVSYVATLLVSIDQIRCGQAVRPLKRREERPLSREEERALPHQQERALPCQAE